MVDPGLLPATHKVGTNTPVLNARLIVSALRSIEYIWTNPWGLLTISLLKWIPILVFGEFGWGQCALRQHWRSILPADLNILDLNFLCARFHFPMVCSWHGWPLSYPIVLNTTSTLCGGLCWQLSWIPLHSYQTLSLILPLKCWSACATQVKSNRTQAIFQLKIVLCES